MRCRKFIAVQSSFFLSFFAFKHHISMWHMPRTRKKHTQTILTVTGMQMQNKANYLHISLSGEQPGWLHHLVKKLTLVMLLTEEIDTQRLAPNRPGSSNGSLPLRPELLRHTATLHRPSNCSEDWTCHYLNLPFTVSLFTCFTWAIKSRLPFTSCNVYKTRDLSQSPGAHLPITWGKP